MFTLKKINYTFKSKQTHVTSQQSERIPIA